MAPFDLSLAKNLNDIPLLFGSEGLNMVILLSIGRLVEG